MDAFMSQFMTKPRPNSMKTPTPAEDGKPEEKIDSQKTNDPSDIIKKL